MQQIIIISCTKSFHGETQNQLVSQLIKVVNRSNRDWLPCTVRHNLGQKSNVHLQHEGEDSNHMRTVNQDSYKGLSVGQRSVPVKPASGSNVLLAHDDGAGGDAADRWRTDASSAYGWKESAGASSSAEQARRAAIMNNVRATHFALGDDAAQWGTTSGTAAAGGVRGGDGLGGLSDRADAAARAARMKEVSIGLGSERLDYSTTNALPAPGAGARAETVKKDTHSTNFELGGERGQYITTRMADMGIRHIQKGTHIPAKTGKWKDVATGKIPVRPRKW